MTDARARPLRIRLLASTMGGGVGQHTIQLYRTLVARGHDVRILALRGPHYRPPVRDEEGIPLEGVGPADGGTGPGAVVAWLRALRPHAADVGVFAKGGLHSGTLALECAARGCFRRLVTIEHNLAFAVEPKASSRHLGGLVPGLGLWWYRDTLRGWVRSLAPHRVICVSRMVADRLADSYRFPHRKLVVVSNGVDPERFRPDAAARAEARRRWGVPPEAFVFGAVGRLSKQKGYDTAIRVFADVRAAAPRPACLVLVGDGPERAALERLVEELGLGDCVRLPGGTRRPEAEYPGLDVFIMPSRWEGFGFTMLEAMACERPAITFAVGGAPEVVAEPGLGWLVPAGDEGAFARAMTDALARGPEELAAMGARGRTHVERHFRSATQMERLADAIEAA